MFLDVFGANSPFRQKQPIATFDEADLFQRAAAQEQMAATDQQQSTDVNGLPIGGDITPDANHAKTAYNDPFTVAGVTQSGNPADVYAAAPEQSLPTKDEFLTAANVDSEPSPAKTKDELEQRIAQTVQSKQPSDEDRMNSLMDSLKGVLGQEDKGFGTKATNTIQDQLLNTGSAIQRLERMRESFKPDFLEIGTRLTALFAGLASKVGLQVTKRDESALADFVTFRQNASENLNLYIKEVTGAQMSEPEAKRLGNDVPVVGTGVFDGDDPITFKTKLDNSLRKMKEVQARAYWLSKQGIQIGPDNLKELSKKYSLDGMSSLMEKEAKAIRKQVEDLKPNLKPEQINAAVARAVAERFGLIYKGDSVPEGGKVSDAILGGGGV